MAWGLDIIAGAIIAGAALPQERPRPDHGRRQQPGGRAGPPGLRDRARALQVTILGVAIGMPAESLAPWCDDFQGATTLTTLDNKLASSLFAA